MHLPKKLQILLEKSDSELFIGGACHIFADELSMFFHEQGYRLWGVESERWMGHPIQGDKLYDDKTLGHVMASKNGVVVDVNGALLSDNYLEEYHYTHRELHGSTCYFKIAFFRECSRSELFEISSIDEETGPLSLHRLYLHPEFVSVARSRARMLIEAESFRFDVATGHFRPKMPIRDILNAGDYLEELDDDWS